MLNKKKPIRRSKSLPHEKAFPEYSLLRLNSDVAVNSNKVHVEIFLFVVYVYLFGPLNNCLLIIIREIFSLF